MCSGIIDDEIEFHLFLKAYNLKKVPFFYSKSTVPRQIIFINELFKIRLNMTDTITDIAWELNIEDKIVRGYNIEKALGFRKDHLHNFWDSSYDDFIVLLKNEEFRIYEYIQLKLDKKTTYLPNFIPEFIKKELENVIVKALRDISKCQSQCEIQCYLMLISIFSPYDIETQYPVDKMTVDIAIPKERIIIEVDGKEYHKDQAKDCYRDIRLRSYNWKVLRYPCKVIYRAYKQGPEYFLKDVLEISNLQI